MNPACQRGVWKYLSEWQRELPDSKERKTIIIPKRLWPVELDKKLLSNLDVVTKEEFTSGATDRCTMIWDEISNNTQFIAPDTWGM